MGNIVSTTLQKAETYFRKAPLLHLRSTVTNSAAMGNVLSISSRYVEKLFCKAPLRPLQFPTTGFEVIDEEDTYEEEVIFPQRFAAGHFYPVNIGDVYASRYQILGKLGFGSTSSVWLARDLQ